MFVRVIPDLGSHVLPRSRTHQHGGSSARRVCRTGALLIFRQRPRIMSWCLGPTAKQSRTDANGCTPSGPRATKRDFQRCGEFPDGTVAKMIKDYILCGSKEKIIFDWLKGKSWKIYRISQYNMLGQKLRLSTSPMKRRKTHTDHWYVNFATSTDHQRVSVRDVRDVSPDTVHPPLCQSSRSSWKTTMFSCYIIIYIHIYIYVCVGKRKSS